MKNLLTEKDHRRRYYLHSKVKKSWVVNAHKREVTIPHSEVYEATGNDAVKELCVRFGYNIQTSII